MVSVDLLRFNHDSIAHAFRDGKSFEGLIRELGERGPGWPPGDGEFAQFPRHAEETETATGGGA